MPEPHFQEIVGISPPGSSPVLPPRSARLPAFTGLQGDASALDSLKVAVIGAGSVGRPFLLHLARLQPAEIRIVDPGYFKAESLLTQPIGPEDVSDAKASNAGRLCKKLSPATRVLAFDGPVQRLDLTALADVHWVFLATDNLTAEVEVGQRCVNLGLPLLQASVHGDTLVAQVRFFANSTGLGPCPACGFGEAEWAHLNQETTFSCEGGARKGAADGTLRTVPTRSVSFLCSMAAELAAMQLLRQVLHLGPPGADTLLEYCGYTHRTVIAPLARNVSCPCDHTTWTRLLPPRALADCTLQELVGTAGLSEDDLPGSAAIMVDDLAFAEQGVCAACGQVQQLCRLVVPEQPAARCAACSGPVFAMPFVLHRPVPAALLLPVFDRPLQAVGADSPRAVVVRGRDRAVWFH